jgi:hypothetical protein
VNVKSESNTNHEAVNQLHLEDNTAISAPGKRQSFRFLSPVTLLGAIVIQELNLD